MDRQGQTYPRTAIRQWLIELVEADVQRSALRTARLLIIFGVSKVELFRDGLVEYGSRFLEIVGRNLQFDATDQIGNEPMQSDHVVIHKDRLDACGFQTALSE